MRLRKRDFLQAGLAIGLVCATVAQSGAASLINAAGASFPYPMYSRWFDEYHKMHPDVQINYQSIGSGGGIRQVTEVRWTSELPMGR